MTPEDQARELMAKWRSGKGNYTGQVTEGIANAIRDAVAERDERIRELEAQLAQCRERITEVFPPQ